MKALIVGYGSIGKRHQSNLQSLGVSEIDVYDPQVQTNELKPQYDFVFICSPNSLHLKSLKEFSSKSRYFFVEKPVSTNLSEAADFKKLVDEHNLHVMVGCNYRFEKGLNLVKAWLEKNNPEIFYVDCEYGHYLPQWRSTPYQQSYSAHRDQGGESLSTAFTNSIICVGYLGHTR